MTPLEAFVVGIVLGALLVAGAYAFIYRVVHPALGLHTCPGHVKHEYEMRAIPTPVKSP